LVLKSGLLVLATLVFLGGLGTRLSKYRGKQDNATTVAKVRLGVEKQPDLAPVHCSYTPDIQEDLGFSVSSNCWQQEVPGLVGNRHAIERTEPAFPVHTPYDPATPQLAYRPPPTLS